MKILDMSAGNRAIWFRKDHPLAVFIDVREKVKPTFVMDSTKMKFADNHFDLVVFDPPHLNTGKNSNMSKCYGHHTTEQILKLIEGSGKEAHRVSKRNALMALKWNTHDIKLERVFKLLPDWEPLFGHLTKDGPRSQTFWVMLRRLSSHERTKDHE
jgi:hypothetical protein